MSNILYFSIHEVLEADEVRLFTEMGHNVFSMGIYQNSNQGGNLRGAIPNLYQNEHLKSIALQCSKENVSQEIVDWCDICIQMHTPPVPQAPFFPWLNNNWTKFDGKRIIWRSIGQNITHLEEELSIYRDKGLEIVRYSPFERTIPNYAGEDIIIRFYKDPEEYKDWNGKDKVLINFTQSLKKRGNHCGYSTFMEVSHDVSAKVYGVANEDLGDLWGGCVSYEEQKRILRDSRVYFYYGTAPASYTLSLMEAMMTGIPVVAAGSGFTKNLYPEQNTNEIEDIIVNGKNGYVSNSISELKKDIELLMEDYDLAKEIGRAGRKTAINLFGKEKIANQWKEFLDK
jgi:hypothetical protein